MPTGKYFNHDGTTYLAVLTAINKYDYREAVRIMTDDIFDKLSDDTQVLLTWFVDALYANLPTLHAEVPKPGPLQANSKWLFLVIGAMDPTLIGRFEMSWADEETYIIMYHTDKFEVYTWFTPSGPQYKAAYGYDLARIDGQDVRAAILAECLAYYHKELTP